MSAGRFMDTAIVGIAFRFPGANDIETYWDNLAERRSSVREIPDERWNWRPLWGDPKLEVNKTFSRWAGLIDDVDAFDHEFFGLLPKVVHNMDPQQRIMLELAWASLEDAGIAPSSLRGRRVGVFAGVTHHDYKELLARARVAIEPYHYTGTATVVVPNRVSHMFGLCGPSLPVDTACSSSLNAIHLAIQSFENGECEMALAGGISLILNPARHISVSKMGTLSPTGSCKTLDDRADGYVRGEGAGFFVLKPLHKALADGDPIHGVIRGSAVNHCGKTHTLSYPSAQAQADVIVEAHRRSGVPISSVNFVELHGTGTAKGDPIEFEGLRLAFARLAEEQGIALEDAYCGLSSAKTNLGHLEAAAGMAGVVKVLLAFRHRRLPGFHDFRTLNSRVSIDGTPFYILDRTRPWPRRGEDTPLRAGISSFGFGGTNAHLVLEEPPAPAAPRRVRRSAPAAWLVPLSARTAGALERRRRDLLAWLREDAGAHDLAEVARALSLQRDHLPLRFVCVVEDLAQLVDALSAESEAPPAETLSEERKAELDAAAAACVARLPKLKKDKRRETLQALAGLFVEGADIAWDALHPGSASRRPRLPVYAFERHRFWLPETGAFDDEGHPLLDDGEPKLHPLLHRNAAAVDQNRFISQFDGREAFLADHVVAGKRMLPGVAYLEMVRAAVVRRLDIGADESVSIRIADVVWLRPLALQSASGRVEIEIDLAPQTDGRRRSAHDFEFQVALREAGAATATLCRGHASVVPAEDETMPLAALLADAQRPWRTAQAIYADFAAQGLVYGPSHHLLRELRCAQDFGVARIDPQPASDEHAGDYMLPPGVADAALQAAVAFLAAESGQPQVRAAIPFTLATADIRCVPVGPIHAYVRRAQDGSGTVDVDLLDERDGGRVCAAFRGLGLHAVGHAERTEAEPQSQPATVAVPASLAQALYVPEWRRQAAVSAGDAIPELVVTGSQAALDRIEPMLRASPRFAQSRIERIVVVGADGERPADDGRIAVRAGVAEDYAPAVAAIAARGVGLQRVLSVGDAGDGDDFSARIDATARHLFALAGAMLRGTRTTRFLHLVPDTDAAVEHLALGAFFKTLRIERPGWSGRVLDGVFADASGLPDRIADECLCEDDAVDVRYRDGVRERRGFAALGARAAAAPEDEAVAFREGGVYLITGGLGGLGRIVARHLCVHHRARVYLTGRSPAGEAQRAAAAEIAALGGSATYLPCDVAVRDDVRRAIAAVHADGFRLDGVLHSAGVIEDNFLMRKSAEEFARVIAPKTLGTWHLDEETRGEPLSLFLLFSSVAGALGNVGQCDYAYGNAFEDAFAHARESLRARGDRAGRTVSVNWPFWRNGGMRLGEAEIEAVRRSFGIVPLEDEPGLDALAFALAQGLPQFLVMPGDAARVREVLGAAPPAEAAGPAVAAADAPDAAAVFAALGRLFAEQLHIADAFEGDRSFKDYGFDSVVMIELIALLEKTFGTLPKTLFFEYPNLGALTAYFLEQHAGTCRALIGAPASEPASAAADAPLPETQPGAQAVADYLSARFAEQLRIEPHFEPDRSFKDYGFDSVVMIELIALLEKTFGTLPKTLFFEHTTLAALTGYFREQHAQTLARVLGPAPAPAAQFVMPPPTLATPPSRTEALVARRTAATADVDEPIAIIGLAGRYPQAPTLSEFWENLRIGRDCIETIPAERADIAARFRFRPGEPSPGRSYAQWGGFLREVDHFDAGFFNISPKEAESIDPNERLFLEVAAHAIEDAGYTPDTLARARGPRENPVGVYVGVMWGDYQLHGVDRPQDAWTTPHSFYWAIANRVSYQFNFSGPSLALDTACSSSLTAIHLACQAIRQGEIDVAIAGASNLSLHPNKYNLLSDLHFLSKDGRCRAFGEGGTGYVPGEGVGAVVLKPLSKARRDGDHIYAIIRASAVNHGGKAAGFTVPNPKRQAALIREALDASGVDPRHISYVEAHGTGTGLGDPVEIKGLTEAFAQRERQYCAIGSVKSNVGHLEAASGVAGLTKVLLQMRHRMLVPSLHSETLNPLIEFAESPFRVQRRLEPWTRPTVERDGRREELPRIAGLSSFGAGGSNAHLVIEEYVDAPHPGAHDEGPVAIVLSARRERALRESALRLAAHLREHPEIGLQDAAYTLQIGRVGMEFRVAFVASARARLIERLRAFGERGALDDEAWSGHRDAARRDPAIAARLRDAAPMIPEWSAVRDLPALASVWVDGADIDWRRLHITGRRHRVPLPGYAYQRERYWVADAPAGAAESAAVSALHPLIDTNVSTLDEQAFLKTFRGDEFFLRDHRLGPRRILPGAAVLEMALQAARLAMPGRRVAELRDVRWHKAIEVGADPAAFRIALFAERGAVAFELYADDDSRAVFASGAAAFDEDAAPAAVADRLDLDAIRARCRVLETRAGIDAAFEAMGFGFGETFRVFERLHRSDEEALAELHAVSVPGVARDAFAMHPALLDGALRTTLAIGGLAAATALRVPVRLERIAPFAAPGDRAIAYARRSAVPVQPGQSAYDIDLCDLEGRVLVRLRGLIAQTAPQLALSAAPAAARALSAPVAVRAAAEPAPHAIAVALLRRLLADVTRLEPQQIDPLAALENYGIDSVMIAALNRGLEARFGEIPKTLFFEHSDIDGVAGHLAEQYADALRAMAAEFPIAAGAAPAAVPVVAPADPASTDAAPDATEAGRRGTVAFLRAIVAETTGLAAAQIDPAAPMENFGIDSVMIAKLTARIAETFGEVPKTLFFEFQEIDALAAHLSEQFPERARALGDTRSVASPAEIRAAEPDALARLHARMREAVGAAADGCGIDTPIADWPLDPVTVMRLLHALTADFDGVEPFAPYRHATLSEWAAHLRPKAGRSDGPTAHGAAAPVGQIAPVPAAPAPRAARTRASSAVRADEDIAIVGLSGRYPGAEDLHAFWGNLAAGRDGIVEIPVSRWDHAPYFHPDRRNKGTVYSKWGGFLDEVDHFDARFFNMTARESELTDPQERLFLQTAWECFEDACYTRRALKGRSVGVFVGVMWASYAQIDVSDEQLKYGRPSTPFASIANRVSYVMNLDGPSLALDTMCSSSLTAIHLACRAIADGDCEMALAGGVNLILHPHKYQQLSASQFLSSDGRCRAFGDGGDGYVPGEGVGAVLLKPLSRAIADGDHVYGVIKATALNHGGKTNGYTVPNQVAQTAVIAKALKRSGWDPRTIEYVEAHGTGTSLGDPIEIAGLTRAFAQTLADTAGAQARIEPQRCLIGSIKSNFGHLESAAAIAGLTKVLMQFRHGRIAPSLHSATLNPNIDFARSPFRVVQSAQPWPARPGGAPRRAALSSFGAGGANAHCLIEDYPRSPAGAAASGRPMLFVLSADGEERLMRYVARMIAFIERGGDPDVGLDLADLAHASQVGREAMRERLAIVATGIDDLLAALRACRDGRADERVARGALKHRNEALESIVEESEKDALVRSLIQTGRLPQLARAWVSMLDVEWEKFVDALYPTSAHPRRPRRMPFPTMPFLGERHWVEEKPEAAAAIDAPHPLIDRNLSTWSSLAYRKRFDGREFYLRDHIVRSDRERMLLPGAAYLEMVRVAGEMAAADEGLRVVAIRNLMWMQPFEIAKAADSLTTRLHVEGDALRLEVLRDSDGGVCVEGELRLQPADAPQAEETIDLPALLAQGEPIDAGHEAIYAGFERMGFLFGPSFRITRERYRLPGGALCRLQLPDFLRAGFGAYGLHPTMLDAVLRSALAVDAGENGLPEIPIVPFALDELEYRHPLAEECYVVVSRRRDAVVDGGVGLPTPAGSEATVYRYDLAVADRDGRVLIRLSGFTGRALAKQPQSRGRELQHFGYDWVPAPLPAAAAEAAPRVVLFATASRALAEAFARRAPAQDRVIPVLIAGVGDAAQTEERIDPFDSDDATRLLAGLRARGLVPDHIVYCDDGADDDAIAVDAARADALHRGIQAVRRLFVACERNAPGAAIRLLYAFRDGARAQPQHEAVAGYARSLLIVNHRFELSTLCDDRTDPEARAAAIFDELAVASGFGGNEIAHRDGRRLRRTLRRLETARTAADTLPIREGGCYLITGGAGKLGLAVARHLARHAGVRLLLNGRSPTPSPSLQRELDALRALGATVVYRSADSADADAVQAMVDAAAREFGALHGVIHCAGVASDRSILDLDDRGFDEMLLPKTDGLILLDRATAAQPLDFFVCFSSVSALLGDLGSGAYAVANRFMDGYARWREAERAQGRRNGRSYSINWPLWATGGMEIAGSDASVFGFSGMQALEEREGLEAMDRILSGDEACVLVSVGDPQRVARTLRLETPPVAPPRAPERIAPPVASIAPIAPVAPIAVAHAAPPSASPSASGGADLAARAEAYVKTQMAAVTKTAIAAIDAQASFEQCGLDSVLLLELHAALKNDFPSLPKTALFEYDSAARMAQFLIAEYGAPLRARLGVDEAPAPISEASAPAAAPAVAAAVGPSSPALPLRMRGPSAAVRSGQGAAPALADEGIAIVGIAGEFPDSPDLDRFWRNLREARDCIRRVPRERGFDAVLNRFRHRAGRAIADAGGFIDDVDLFDPALFRMSRAEADKLDPQLRVLLRTAWRAVEDAAYTPKALAESRVGVFVGAMNEDFTWIASELQARSETYLGPGAVSSELSNRLSFLMNLHGPSLTLSTACASSLTALHVARRAILAGDCEAALVGGVNLSLHAGKYHLLNDMNVLSPDGHERTFDDAAKGLVPSEGVAVVVLKRLGRAIADGDRIHGVLRGSRIAHSGVGAGQFMPNIRVLEDTAAECIAEAGVDVADLTYIESHGTGTELGDPIELKALSNAVRRSTAATGFCAIGSKANIGHMEAASGLGSLIKVLLAMRHGEIAPCAKLRNVNGSFEVAASPFHFPREAMPWPKNARGTRVAGINSFGMGGSNAFVVVESFEPPAPAPDRAAEPAAEPALFALSARSQHGLREYAAAVAAFARAQAGQAQSPAAFADWAYVTQVGRVAWRYRLALVARDATELAEALEAWSAAPEAARQGLYVCDIESPTAVDTLRLLGGEAGRGFFASLLETRRLDTLAEMWARGAAIDWSALQHAHPRRRASFPGAPFESERCDLRHLLTDAEAVASATVVSAPERAETRASAALPAIDLPPGGWHRLDALASADDGAGDDAGDGSVVAGIDDDALPEDTACDLAGALGEAPLLLQDGTVEEGALHYVSELVDTELLHTLQRFGQEHGIAIETLVTAAWAVLMNRHTRARRSQFGVFGTGLRETEPTLLSVRVQTVSRQKMLPWLQAFQLDLLRRHRDAPGSTDQARRWDERGAPYDTLVAFDRREAAEGDAGSRPSALRPRYELATAVSDDALELTLIYRAHTPDYARAGMLLEQFVVLLEGIVRNPDKMPSALGMRTRAESRERFWKTMEAVTE